MRARPVPKGSQRLAPSRHFDATYQAVVSVSLATAFYFCLAQTLERVILGTGQGFRRTQGNPRESLALELLSCCEYSIAVEISPCRRLRGSGESAAIDLPDACFALQGARAIVVLFDR